MGLLDDAIRDHLDLKRRRGSDPTEIARMEREALGPVRRGPEPFEAPYHRRPTCDAGDIRVRAAAGAQATQLYEALADEDDVELEPQPTAEYDVVGAGVAAGHGSVLQAGGDVMGETPGFPQQTPAHDRLWFERKPPQEFDF